MTILKKSIRFITTLCTLALLLIGFAKTAQATDITVDGGATGAEYAAYRLLDATDGGEKKFAYTVNDAYRAILKATTGAEEDQDIVAHIEGLDSTGIRTFADTVYDTVKTMTPDVTTTTGTFTGIDQGYYLIVETKTASTQDSFSQDSFSQDSPSQDSFSLVMLDTAGQNTITVKTKEGVPKVEKKVKETNDSTGSVTDWQDAADYDFYDIVPFQLTGTVSEQIAGYNRYYYEFHDTLSAGLTFEKITNVYVLHETGTQTAVAASNYTLTLTQLDNSLSVQFTDLKSLNVVASDKIVVEYEATLNENAVIGAVGNPNTVYLEYSNNPYSTDADADKPEDIGVTPEDKVIVFTYQLKANKIDGTTKEALSGAGFTLYKKNSAGKYVAVGDEVTGVTTFEFKGLDAGDFKLVETTVPAGYNKIDDLIFTIVAEYDDTEATDPKLTNLVVNDETGTKNETFTPTLTDGSLITDIANYSGVALPSTGGIGTTVLYALGGLMVLASAIILVVKKRMHA